MEVNIIRVQKKVTLSIDIPNGTIFVGTIGDHMSKLFFKGGSEKIFPLDGYKGEGSCWTGTQTPVTNYTPVSKITAEV
jgi:hypothetical protein